MMKRMEFIGIIPARYASTRFPAKPLAILGGKTVIQRVYEQVSSVLDNVCVATDDDRIHEAVEAFGGRVVMTSANHKSGTDRICEAYNKLYPNTSSSPHRGGQEVSSSIIINIQGDEPFIQPSQIQTVMDCFNDSNTQIATLGKPFTDIEALKNPNSPKIVVDHQGYAMYFSRSVIPFIRGKEEENWIGSYPFLKHIGLYAYRADVLKEVTKLPQSSLELAESLEQLRWLQNGYRIKVGLTDVETIGIDTPEDLQKAEEFLLKVNG
jgi:3-deoxy-manno-octulosonate cytidylyltransferase (CMP-KDO synthetase)